MSKIYAAYQFNLTDYQDELTCTLYTQGCLVQCPWCHNKNLWHTGEGVYTLENVLEEIDHQKIKPTAIAFSGGEPLLHTYSILLDSVILKKLGYKTVLYTSGCSGGLWPDVLHKGFDKIVLSIKGGEEFYTPPGLRYLVNKVVFLNSIGFDFEVQVLRSIHGDDTERISGPFRAFAPVIN